MKAELLKQKVEIKLYQFLLGLDDTIYSTVHSSIFQINPLPSIKKVYSMITTKEQHKQISKFAKNDGEVATFAAVKTSSDNALTQRTHCCKQGHDASSSFQLVGYPDWCSERSIAGGSSSNRERE